MTPSSDAAARQAPLSRTVGGCPVIDLALGVLGVGASAMSVWARMDDPRSGWCGWAFAAIEVGLSVCLAVRSRWRRAAFVASYVLLGLMALVMRLSPTNLGVSPLIVCAPIVLYTVARYEPFGWGVAGLLVGLTGAFLSPTLRMPGVRATVDWAVVLVLVVTYLVASSLRRNDERHVVEMARASERAELESQRRVAAAQEAERTRIASEMHDIVGHSLTVVIVQANAAIAIGSPEASQQALVQVRDSAKGALAEVRSLVTDLRSPETTGVTGDITRLRDLPAEASASGLDLTWSVPDEADLARAQTTWPTSARLAVLRIVQESLTNALKHAARPAHGRLDVTIRPGWCDVTMSNDAQDAAVVPGNGLVGMQERARRAGGSLTVDHTGGRMSIAAHIQTSTSAGGAA